MTDSRVTLVTGATGGIGPELCRRIAIPGETLFIHTGRNRDKAEAVAAEVRAAGAAAHVIVSDFAEPANAREVVAEVAAKAGRLDAVAHLAGMSKGLPFGELGDDDFELLMAINAGSFFHLASAALPLLQKAERGRVVSAGSWVAHRLPPNPDSTFPGTAAARAALNALTRSLAAQLAPANVTVNVVALGRSRRPNLEMTPEFKALIPMGRFAEPEEFAAVFAFLLSKEAGYITGQCIHVDGGIVSLG